MSTPPKQRFDYRQILRFGSVGLANTALGYSVILIGLALGWGDIFSNLAGYAVGLIFGFFLNRNWTFNSTSKTDKATALKYLAGFIVAYSANLGVIAVARTAGFVDNPLTHLAGICIYSILFYLICSNYVFTSSRQTSSAPDYALDQRSLTSLWPEFSVFVGWLSAFLFVPYMTVSHDVVWQMWIARQLLGGAELYKDILEVNPPLWFWLATPVQWAAQTFEISSVKAIVSAVLMLTGISLAVLCALIWKEPVRIRAGLLWAAFAALILIPLQDFAQREHLCLLGSIPYLVLAARRADHVKISWPVALMVGLIAAPGFALKHYFILVPVFLELWLVYRLRSKWSPLRPEIMALLVGAISYAVAVLVFTPDYLTTIIPMLRTAYDGYGAPVIGLVAKPWVAIWLFAMLALKLNWGKATSLTVSSTIAASAFCVSYFAQQKGWSYHAVPATCLLFFSIASLWIAENGIILKKTRLFIYAAVLAIFMLPSITAGPYSNRHEPPVRKLLQLSTPGESVIMLTGHPSHIWPMVEHGGFKWPSRHFAFWMTHAVAAQEKTHGSLAPDLSNLANTVRKQTLQDLQCNPPDLILVDDFINSNSPGFDILNFFEKDEAFKELFSHYLKVQKLAMYTAYKKQTEPDPMPPQGCRTIH